MCSTSRSRHSHLYNGPDASPAESVCMTQWVMPLRLGEGGGCYVAVVTGTPGVVCWLRTSGLNLLSLPCRETFLDPDLSVFLSIKEENGGEKKRKEGRKGGRVGGE